MIEVGKYYETYFEGEIGKVFVSSIREAGDYLSNIPVAIVLVRQGNKMFKGKNCGWIPLKDLKNAIALREVRKGMSRF